MNNVNYLDLYKKGSHQNDDFLSKTCKFFLEKKLLESIKKEFIEDRIPDEDRIINKLKKVCILEGNTLYVPYEEITDIINLSIFVEREQALKSILENKITKINTLSNVMENGIQSENYENNDSVFTVESVREFILESCKPFTKDVAEKNEKIVVTFS